MAGLGTRITWSKPASRLCRRRAVRHLPGMEGPPGNPGGPYVPSCQTIRRPGGLRFGSRQNASCTKRLNKSGGSSVGRGSALTVPRTVCRPGVPARMLEFSTSVVDVVEVVSEGGLSRKS